MLFKLTDKRTITKTVHLLNFMYNSNKSYCCLITITLLIYGIVRIILSSVNTTKYIYTVWLFVGKRTIHWKPLFTLIENAYTLFYSSPFYKVGRKMKKPDLTYNKSIHAFIYTYIHLQSLRVKY